MSMFMSNCQVAKFIGKISSNEKEINLLLPFLSHPTDCKTLQHKDPRKEKGR